MLCREIIGVYCEILSKQKDTLCEQNEKYLNATECGHFRLRTDHEGPEEKESYSSTFSLNSAVDGSTFYSPRLHRLPPRKRLSPPCTEGSVGFRASLDWCRNTLATGFRSPAHPACSKSLYPLSYSSTHTECVTYNNTEL
jgi:hypothetical protein